MTTEGQGNGQGTGTGQGTGQPANNGVANGGTAGGTGAGPSGGTGTGEAAPWYGQADEDTAAYIKVKGWQDSSAVIKSYREAEKFLGRDPNSLLTIPRADDAAGQMAMFDKLGRPAEAKGYDMTGGIKGMQVDPTFAPVVADIFHKAGLTKAQGDAVAKAYNEYALKGAEAELADYNQRVDADKATLQAEWRGGFERKFQAAVAAAEHLGLPAEAIDGIESKIGYAETIKLLSNIGAKLGEDKFVGSEGGNPGGFFNGMTPAEAKAAWAQKLLDPSFSAALTDRNHPGHKAAAAEQTRMFKVMYPEG
jgi:hypothetical protein